MRSPPTDMRMTVEGIAWRFRTGAPWRDIPQRFGHWNSIYQRFAHWSSDGTWARLLGTVQGAAESAMDDLAGRGIKVTIPERENQKPAGPDGGSGGRPRKFDPDAYKGRNVVERCFNKLKQCQAIATRSHLAGLTLAATLIWTR